MIKLKNLPLGQKFTLLLTLVFLGGVLASGVALSSVLSRGTQGQLTTNALMLMETMNAIRGYTSEQVQPEIADRLDEEFLPESVPAYSAREVFETFRLNPNYSDFFYKEATLNPTNLRDKADAFEAELVNNFRANPNDASEVSGFRSTPAGDLYYIARPIKIAQQSCLECHSTPAAAPASMIERYGSENGFGWELDEIVGAQMISVPAERVVQAARQSLVLILGIFIVAFAVAIVLVNLWLKRLVVRPLNRMAMVAEAVSMGDTEAEFIQDSQDEVGKLAEAFNRMRVSLQMAMKRLERYREGRRSGSSTNDLSQ
jgi:HAMP domain-containing protein